MTPLSEPVEPSLLAVRNCDIPLLDTELQLFYLEALRTPDGVPHEVFWRLFDKCDCNQYFLKSYLHSVHGPSCLDWKRGMGALPSRCSAARTRHATPYGFIVAHSQAIPSTPQALPHESAAPQTPTVTLTSPSTPSPSIAAASISSTSGTTTPSTPSPSSAAHSTSSITTSISLSTSASPTHQTDKATSSSLSDKDFDKISASLCEDPAFGNEA